MIRSADTGLPPGCWTPVPAKKTGDGHHETKNCTYHSGWQSFSETLTHTNVTEINRRTSVCWYYALCMQTEKEEKYSHLPPEGTPTPAPPVTSKCRRYLHHKYTKYNTWIE